MLSHWVKNIAIEIRLISFNICNQKVPIYCLCIVCAFFVLKKGKTIPSSLIIVTSMIDFFPMTDVWKLGSVVSKAILTKNI